MALPCRLRSRLRTSSCSSCPSTSSYCRLRSHRQQHVAKHRPGVSATPSLLRKQILQLIADTLDPQRVEHEKHRIGIGEEPEMHGVRVARLEVLASDVAQHHEPA